MRHPRAPDRPRAGKDEARHGINVARRVDRSLPDALRTGFPGETDEQFGELAEFVRQQRFERLGVFTYSYEEDTPSAKLEAQIPEDVMEQRRGELMAIQQEVSFELTAQQVGTKQDIIIDQPLPGADDVWLGRSHADAPDVDASVFVTANGRKLKPGSIVACEIVANQDYDLVGVAVGKVR